MTAGAIVLVMPRGRLIVLLSALFGATLAAQSPAPRPVRPPTVSSSQCQTQASDQVVSPVVMASWLVRVQSDGTRALEFLVLWRGTPTWFARGGATRLSGGGNCRGFNKSIQRGDVQLQIEFDAQTRLATIQKKEIELRDQNVVLVDGVDDGKGLQIVKTLRVDPALPAGDSPLWLGGTLRQSEELVSFLRCDVRLDDPLAQKMAEIVCASVLGK